jgi:hypothetical protein
MNSVDFLDDDRLRQFLIDTMWDWLQLHRTLDRHAEILNWESFDMGGVIPVARLFGVSSHWWQALDAGLGRCRNREEVEAWLFELQDLAHSGFSETVSRWGGASSGPSSRS